MSDRDISKDPRVKKTTSLLQNVPTLSVPQAMRAVKFTQAESENARTQMWIPQRMQSNTPTPSTKTPTSINIPSLEIIASSLSQSTTSTAPIKLPPILKQQQKTSRATQQDRVNLLLVANISLLTIYSRTWKFL